MSKGKRDALILSLIGLILYSLIYYNFVFKGAKVDIDSVQTKISEAEAKKAALDEDIKNLPTLKRNLEMKNVQNERLEEYLMSAANLPDNIEYIDKLAKLFNNKFKTVSIGRPTENSVASRKYYQFGIEVNASMTYTEATNLINYIEGGSKKVKVTTFNITPDSSTAAIPMKGTAANQPQANAEQNYALKMTINLYSLELGNLDKVYEYSRNRFNRFNDTDGVVFVPTKISENSAPTAKSPVQEKIATGRDIDITIESFLAGGQNFWVYGAGLPNPIKYKSTQRSKVLVTFTGDNYDVYVSNGVKSYTLKGKTINNDTISMYVTANFPLDVPENRKVGADIQIINNSPKKVNVNLRDRVNRAKLIDRNGKDIIKMSDSEKVYII